MLGWPRQIYPQMSPQLKLRWGVLASSYAIGIQDGRRRYRPIISDVGWTPAKGMHFSIIIIPNNKT